MRSMINSAISPWPIGMRRTLRPCCRWIHLTTPIRHP